MKNDSFITRHLAEAGESYGEHLLFTVKIGLRLVLAGLVVIIHGLMPFLFVHKGSCMIEDIYATLKSRKESCEQKRKKAA